MKKRTLLLITAVITIGLKSFSQVATDTTYYSKRNLSYQLTLNTNKTFERVIYNPYCGLGSVTDGTFKIKSDTLTLKYNELDFKGPHIIDKTIISRKTSDSIQSIQIDVNYTDNSNLLEPTIFIDDEFQIIEKNTLKIERKHKKSILKVYNFMMEVIFQTELLENHNYQIEFHLENKEVDKEENYLILKAKSEKLVLKDEFGKRIRFELKEDNSQLNNH